MPMYRGGQEIQSAFANAGTEIISGYSLGNQVYSGTVPMPVHTHVFEVGIEFATGGTGDMYGRHHANLPTGDVGTVTPSLFTGSIATREIPTLRVGNTPNIGHAWSFSFDSSHVGSTPGTGDGAALQQVWVETEPDTYLLLFDINAPSSGVFNTVNQINGIELNYGHPGWSLENVNSGRLADANPWKVYEGQTKKCLINFNNSIPAQVVLTETFIVNPMGIVNSGSNNYVGFLIFEGIQGIVTPSSYQGGVINGCVSFSSTLAPTSDFFFGVDAPGVLPDINSVMEVIVTNTIPSAEFDILPYLITANDNVWQFRFTNASLGMTNSQHLWKNNYPGGTAEMRIKRML